MTTTVTDRIEKQVRLKAPRARVWRALTDADEFGSWFRVSLEGPFREGQAVRGRILHPGYEHVTMEVLVERLDPQHYFAYRWHPYAVDPAIDYSPEPMTLVEFRLDEAGGETLLTITESGFGRIPLGRRAEAFRMNEGGWSAQARNLERYVANA
jgi:uncharacterized protein YndB with AHSA1/START domain